MEIIKEEKINEIRNTADIVSIISQYIPLKSQGKNYFGICPFHDDHTPSMSVSKEKQVFKCFVCNKGGNVFTFVKDYENISFIEAVKKVADKVGIPLDINYTKKTPSKFKEDYEIMNFTTQIFQNNLNSKEGKEAKKYLNSRNITEEIIKDFKIGYALNDNKYLYSVLTKKGYSLNKLDDLGLITKDGVTGYDKFVNRVMIPICNEFGDVVGYTGRILTGDKESKYINTKETHIYKKGNILFNYHNAKEYIRNEKNVILVEGNMDAIRVYSEGIKNVLALMGTALTTDQINMIKKLRVPVTLILDSDNAGELATDNVGLELTNNNIQVNVVRLNGAKDPDEYIVKFGKEKFIDAIKNGLNYFDYKLNKLKKNKNLANTEELINYVKEVLKMIINSDNLTKEITLRKISDEYNISYDVLKSEIEFNKEPEKDKEEVKIVKKDKYSECVKVIIYYMMNDIKYLTIFNNKLGFLKNKEERNLVREIEYYIDTHGKINFADFISYAEVNDNIRDLVNNIIGKVNENDLNEKTFMEYINCVKEILNKEERERLTNELKLETDINKQIEISKLLTELVKGSVKNDRD